MYGPVCTVVWEGEGCEAFLYPDFSSKYVADFIPFPQISRLLKSYADLYQIKELSDMLI